MREKIRDYVSSVTQNAPRTRRADELREELLSGCFDKYEDLIARGMDPQEAYEAVISGIGDVDELFREPVAVPSAPGAARGGDNAHVLLVTLGVGLYLMAVFVFFVLAVFTFARAGIIALVGIALLATFLIIVAGIMRAPRVRYEKKEDTIVEDVKVQMAGEDYRRRQIRQAASSSLWSLVVIAYLGISFLTHLWHVTWLIFLLGSALQCVVTAAFAAPGHRLRHLSGVIWTVTTLLYFVLSFWTGRWDITWLAFLVALAVHQVFRLARIWGNLS